MVKLIRRKWETLVYIILMVFIVGFVGYLGYQDNQDHKALIRCVDEQSLDVTRQKAILDYCWEKIREGEYR